MTKIIIGLCIVTIVSILPELAINWPLILIYSILIASGLSIFVSGVFDVVKNITKKL